MTLSNLLSTLTSQKVMAQVYDSDGKTLLSEIKAITYESLDDELQERTVASWSIEGIYTIKVTLVEQIVSA